MPNASMVCLTSLLLLAAPPVVRSQGAPAGRAPSPPFVADARLGELYLIGRTFSTANKSFTDDAEHLLASIDSARLALRYPARTQLYVAPEQQQLLVLTGTVRNPQRTSVHVTAGNVMSMRFFGTVDAQRALYGQEGVFDPATGQPLDVALQPGASARYAVLVRVPADGPSVKIAALRRGPPLRRYDLEPAVTTVGSVFPRVGLSVASAAEATAGQRFDLDAFDMTVGAARRVSTIGSYVSSPARHVYAVDVQVTNRSLLPERWGWQYCTPQLTDAAGDVVPWSSDLLEASTGLAFSRDLGAGETVTVVYVFVADHPVTPAALRLTMASTKRRVSVALR